MKTVLIFMYFVECHSYLRSRLTNTFSKMELLLDQLNHYNDSTGKFADLVTFDFRNEFKSIEEKELWFQGESFLHS